MPTYEYVCEACGNEFENFASMSAPPLKKCPKCKKNKVVRKISTGGGIIFKGGGFYETDYRGDAYQKAEAAEKSSGDPKPAETKTEAKPADTAAPAADAKTAETQTTETKTTEPAKVESKPKSEPKPAAKSSSAKSRKR